MYVGRQLFGGLEAQIQRCRLSNCCSLAETAVALLSSPLADVSIGLRLRRRQHLSSPLACSSSLSWLRRRPIRPKASILPAVTGRPVPVSFGQTLRVPSISTRSPLIRPFGSS